MDLTALDDAFRRGSTPLVRTWFDDDALWDHVVESALSPGRFDSDHQPNITPINDVQFSGATPLSLRAAIGARPECYALVAEAFSVVNAPDLTVLFLDLDPDADVWLFRVELSEVAEIELNLSIANMAFAEFADEVAYDGVFRGIGPTGQPG